MKTKILIGLVVFLCAALPAGAQQKAWQNLLELLRKEAAYFQGKEGFIQQENSDYSRFFIQEAVVSRSLIVFGMWFRGDAGDSTEQYVRETVVLKPEPPVIVSAEIYYDFSFYFKDFPRALFLRIELDEEEKLIDKIENIFKDVITGHEDRNEMEDKTNRILLPFRAKNREKIFQAIDEYQRVSLKPGLDYQRMF